MLGICRIDATIFKTLWKRFILIFSPRDKSRGGGGILFYPVRIFNFARNDKDLMHMYFIPVYAFLVTRYFFDTKCFDL